MKLSENIFFSFGEKTENFLFSITLFRKNILGEKKDLHAWNRVMEFFFYSLCLDFFHFVTQLKKKSGFFLTGVKLSQKRIMKRLFFSE